MGRIFASYPYTLRLNILVVGGMIAGTGLNVTLLTRAMK